MDIHLIFTTPSGGGDGGGNGRGNNGGNNGINGLNNLHQNQVLLRILGLQKDDTHYLPFVQHARNCKDRLEILDKEVLKGMKKTNEMVREMTKEMEFMEEDENVSKLLNNVIEQNHSLSIALKQLEPLFQSNLKTLKDLSDYFVPPTEELFKKKALDHILKTERVPIVKKNTCAICLENTADVIIKRECHLKTKKSSIPVNNSSNLNININSNSPLNIVNSILHGTHSNNTTTSTTTTSSTSSSNSTPSTSNNNSPSRKNVVCEKAICNCGPTMCQDCLIKHYWVSTSNGLKSFSKCVCCRAEFCLADIRRVEYYSDEIKENEGETLKIIDSNNNSTTTTTTTTSSNNSKKRKESTIQEPSQKKYKPEGKSKTNNSKYIILTDKLKTSSSDNFVKNNKIFNCGNDELHQEEEEESEEEKEEKEEENNNTNNTNNNDWSLKRLIQFWR